MRIAQVAIKYQVKMVKVTGGQRIDLLGVQKSDLPLIWKELGIAQRPRLRQGFPHLQELRGDRLLPLRSWRLHQARPNN